MINGMRLGPLYHWSPIARRDAISRDGLQPGCDPTICTQAHQRLYLAPDPHSAWMLSGAVAEEIDAWDLWQVMELADDDEVHIRSEFGPRILEVSICNPIPPQRLRWIGSRRSSGGDVLLQR